MTKFEAEEKARELYRRYRGEVDVEDCDFHLFPLDGELTAWDFCCYFRTFTLVMQGNNERQYFACAVIQGQLFSSGQAQGDPDQALHGLNIRVCDAMVSNTAPDFALRVMQVQAHLGAALACAQYTDQLEGLPGC